MEKTIILITGASRGLGAAIAETLAGESRHIIALSRTAGALEELDDRIRHKRGSASLAVMDICDQTALEKVTRTIRDRWGRLDMLVHAAVFAPTLTPVAHSDFESLSKAIQINLLATDRLIFHLHPLLKQSPMATAIFFDDKHVGEHFFGHYGSSKAAQIALVRSWAAENRNFGILVKIFEPKPMKTALRATFFPGEDRSKLTDPMDEAQRICCNFVLL